MESQVLFVLNKAIDTVGGFKASDSGEGDTSNIRVVSNYAAQFKRCYAQTYAAYRATLAKSAPYPVDEHKLAGIAMFAVLRVGPMCLADGCKAYGLSAAVAYHTALYMLRFYQVNRLWGNGSAARQKLAELEKTYPTPGAINGEDVKLATIRALRQLAIAVNKCDSGGNYVNKATDFLPLLSTLLFYIDSHSCAEIKKLYL
jgi:hypothetical protein